MTTDAKVSVVELYDSSTNQNYFLWSVKTPDGGTYADGECWDRVTAIAHAKEQYQDWLNKQ